MDCRRHPSQSISIYACQPCRITRHRLDCRSAETRLTKIRYPHLPRSGRYGLGRRRRAHSGRTPPPGARVEFLKRPPPVCTDECGFIAGDRHQPRDRDRAPTSTRAGCALGYQVIRRATIMRQRHDRVRTSIRSRIEATRSRRRQERRRPEHEPSVITRRAAANAPNFMTTERTRRSWYLNVP
jgi:hypothetical protein